MREGPAVYSIREAKAHLSELVHMVEQGAEVTISSHGRPKVRLNKADPPSSPFRVARRWLTRMPVAGRQTPAEQLIREDRDGRG